MGCSQHTFITWDVTEGSFSQRILSYVFLSSWGFWKLCLVSSLCQTFFLSCPGTCSVSHSPKSWHLFLQRQGLQPAHNKKPSAPSLSFHGNMDCTAILACQFFDWRLCSSLLQPSPELVVAPERAERSALGRLSESSTSSLPSPAASMPLSSEATTAFLCTEDIRGWAWCVYWTRTVGWFLGQEYVRTCTIHVQWHLNWPWL